MYLAFPYWYLKLLFSEIKLKEETERKLFSLRKIISDSELSGLKNQINPHFLYNILNFLYSQALPFSSQLSNSILKLSEMMRYAITENDSNNKVPLAQEIDYVKKYIELENLQQKNGNLIQLDIKGNLNYRRILPMTFQPILENCFKFGRDINFHLEIQESHIHFISTFTQKNTINTEEIYVHFQEVKKRILSEYQENIFLSIASEKQIYKLHLLLNS
jgi:LytS/YehU family sensor histidine kinase